MNRTKTIVAMSKIQRRQALKNLFVFGQLILTR